MSNKSAKVQESGEVTAPQVSNYTIESYDDGIRSARAGKSLSPNVQAVFDKMKAAIDYAQANGGKAQISFPHNDYPLKNDKLVNAYISNAITSGKKKFSNIAFSVVIDAINRDGNKMNASVLRVSIKTEEQIED
jgi:hypothetical protein